MFQNILFVSYKLMLTSRLAVDVMSSDSSHLKYNRDIISRTQLESKGTREVSRDDSIRTHRNQLSSAKHKESASDTWPHLIQILKHNLQ